MKQFDRQFLEEYRRIPKKTNSLYQNYYNPTVEGGFTAGMPATGERQSQPQTSPQTIERWPEGYIPLLPKHMQGYNSNQILDELKKSYEGNQNLTNQRNIFNNDLVAQRTAIDKRGQEEFNRMQNLEHQLSYYPTMSENLRKHSQRHLDDFHFQIIMNTPNKSQLEANEVIRQKYGNRFSPINMSPQDLQRYGIGAPSNTNIPIEQKSQPQASIVSQQLKPQISTIPQTQQTVATKQAPLSTEQRKANLQGAINNYVAAVREAQRNKIAYAVNPTPAMRQARQEISKYDRNGNETRQILTTHGIPF